MYVNLENNVGGGAKGTTLKCVPNKTFFKGVPTYISEAQWKLIEKAGQTGLFKTMSDEDYEAWVAKSNKEEAERLKQTRERHETASAVAIGEKIDPNVSVEPVKVVPTVEDNNPKEPEVIGDEPDTPEEPTPEVVDKIVDFKHVYTEKEAYDLLKADQVTVLKDRGYSVANIGSVEADRVKQILESNPTA